MHHQFHSESNLELSFVQFLLVLPTTCYVFHSAPHVSPTPLVDASSCSRMTAHWVHHRAVQMLHYATFFTHSAGGCPMFWDSSSRVQLQYSRVVQKLADASLCGGMMTHQGAPSSCANATCTMLHSSPCYILRHAIFLAHSAGGCPIFGMVARGCNSSTPEPWKYNMLYPLPLPPSLPPSPPL